jgi:hypothetical protein
LIFTIGHSNIPAGRLVELLQQHEIATVLDVRSMPYSRYQPPVQPRGDPAHAPRISEEVANG